MKYLANALIGIAALLVANLAAAACTAENGDVWLSNQMKVDGKFTESAVITVDTENGMATNCNTGQTWDTNYAETTSGYTLQLADGTSYDMVQNRGWFGTESADGMMRLTEPAKARWTSAVELAAD